MKSNLTILMSVEFQKTFKINPLPSRPLTYAFVNILCKHFVQIALLLNNGRNIKIVNAKIKFALV